MYPEVLDLFKKVLVYHGCLHSECLVLKLDCTNLPGTKSSLNVIGTLKHSWLHVACERQLEEASFQIFQSFLLKDVRWTLEHQNAAMSHWSGFCVGFKAIRDLEKGSKLKRYWEIADYKQNYDSHLVTPNDVAKAILNALDSAKSQSPPQLFLAFQDREDLLEQARQSSRR